MSTKRNVSFWGIYGTDLGYATEEYAMHISYETSGNKL